MGWLTTQLKLIYMEENRKAKLDPTCLRAIGQCSSRYGPTAFIKARFSFVVCLADVETELYGQ